MDEAKYPHRLREGKSHFVSDDRDGVHELKVGEVVDLTASQSQSFRDKFEPIGNAPPTSTSTSIESEIQASHEEDEGDDEDDEEVTNLLGDPPAAGSVDESPIARRRREKAERKAARRAAHDVK